MPCASVPRSAVASANASRSRPRTTGFGCSTRRTSKSRSRIRRTTMSDLSAQRRLAADVLDVGKNRVWFDPEAQGEIAEAITREDVRELVAEGTIDAQDAKSNSRGRARERNRQRAAGHRKGPGTRKGTAGAREDRKDAWMSRIRAQRRRLKELR